MAKVGEFVITLREYRAMYHTGDEVAGQLRLVVVKPIKLRGLSIRLKGKAYCCWTTSSGSSNNRSTDRHQGKELLLNISNLLVGYTKTDCGTNPVEMPVGMHVFPFSFYLPELIPSSYKDDIASIRYYLVGCLDRNGKSNYHTRTDINFMQVLDTNMPQYCGPINASDETIVGCMCCISGHVLLYVELERKAYCPGETICFKVRCNNNTSRTVTGINAKLTREVIYIAEAGHDAGHWTGTDTITKVRGPAVSPGEVLDWNVDHLHISSTSIPPTIHCKVLEVTYLVKVCVSIELALDLNVYVPVVIGTVPLRRMIPDAPDLYGNPAAISALPLPHTGVDFPDDPPPSYEMAMRTAPS